MNRFFSFLRRSLVLLFISICSVTFLFGQTDNTFRFAILTDLHITKTGNTDDDLQRAVEQINSSGDIEFVLVTGDITDEGDRVSLQKAKDILDGLKIKYYAIPGNHETKWSESGVTAFGDIFDDERFKMDYKGFLFLGFNTGPLMRMADGHIAPQDISWLRDELKRTGVRKPVFLVTHYPLLTGDVDNWYDLTDAVRPYNIRAFLGGHYHANRLLSYDGIPGILSRSVLRATQPAGGYSVLEITPDSLLVYEHNIGEARRKWAALSLNNKYYDLQGETNKYPDFSVNCEYPFVKETWLISTGVGIYSSPAVIDGKLYVGNDFGKLTCYTLSKGNTKWSFQSQKRIVGTPAVADGVVVFGSADKNIYGLNARNGRRLWTVTAEAPVLGAVTIENGVAYIGASDSSFRAINIKTGKTLWTYRGVKGYIETKPCIAGDAVIFGAWDCTLYALNKNTGAELWKWAGGLVRMLYSPAAVWPVAANDKVFITDPQRAMTAIDLKTGETVWRTFQSMVRETIAVSEDRQRVYSKTMNDSIVAYSTVGNMPKEVWASDVGFGYEHAPSMPVEKDGVVFGSTKNGLIFALDAMSGRVLWKHKVGNSLISTVVPLSKNKVLFTATGGEVGLLSVSEGQRSTKNEI